MAVESPRPDPDSASCRSPEPKHSPSHLAETAEINAASELKQTRDHVPSGEGEVPLQAPCVELPKEFGRYRIQSRIGHGGMGSVFLAHDTQLDRTVALKVPRLANDSTSTMVQRFLREARAAAMLSHPNICPIFDVGEIGGIQFIAMGFIEGHPLTAFIATGRPQPEKSVALTVRKVALALDEAHRHGIVHRDLKPANIMIDKRREPIVMDFGFACRVDEGSANRLTQDGVLVGTPSYMSPEQVDRRAAVGPASDIYSLGVVLFELLTCRCPFEGNLVSVIGQILHTEPDSVRSLRPDVSPVLDSICLKALAKDPNRRYASMQEFAHALAEFLKGEPAGDAPLLKPMDAASLPKIETFAELLAETLPAAAAPAAVTIPTLRRSSAKLDALRARQKRKKWIAWAAVGAGLLIAGLIALSLPGGRHDQPPTLPAPVVATPEPPARRAATPPQFADDVAPSAGVPVSTVAPVTTTPNPVGSDAVVPARSDVTSGASKRSPAAPATADAASATVSGLSTAPPPSGSAGSKPEHSSAPSTASALPAPDGSSGNESTEGLTKEDLKQQFRLADRNGDGKLDPTEIGQHVILRADKNHDRRLTLSELQAAYESVGSKLFAAPTEEELKKPARLLPPARPARPGPGPGPPGGRPPGPGPGGPPRRP